MNVTPSTRPEGRQVPPRLPRRVGPSPSLKFANAARALGDCARRRGLSVPAFRSPPRVPEVSRTLRRRADGSVSVAVQVRNRPFGAVVADMVEGIVVANHLTGADATRTRTALWEALTRAERDAARPHSTSI
jgi:hypothetical protein